jgi:hypothetical protein
MRRKLVLALSFCLCAPWLAGCHNSSSRKSLAELIPADALVVLSLNWQAVRGDEDLLKLVKGSEFKKVFGQLNVSEEEITDLAVFGDGAEGAAGSTGMLLSGSFDANDATDSLKERGWREQDYEGHEIYLSPTDNTRLAALDSDALVVGTEKGVEGSIRAESDDASAFVSTDAYKRLSKLFDTAQHPVSMMIAFPQQFQDAADTALQVSSVVMDFAGVGALGQLMSKIGYSRAIGCSIGHEGDSFPVELVAVMKDEDAATLISGGLTLLKGIGALSGERSTRSSEGAEAMRNFQSMSVSREKDVLSIGLVMSRENLFSN